MRIYTLVAVEGLFGFTEVLLRPGGNEGSKEYSCDKCQGRTSGAQVGFVRGFAMRLGIFEGSRKALVGAENRERKTQIRSGLGKLR